MSSSALKYLSKEINAALSSANLELPTSLRNLLHDYLEKHPAPDDESSPRLHEDLLSSYNNHVADTPARLAPFFSILFILKPTLAGAGRLLQWWEKLRDNVLGNLKERGLAREVKSILLRILVWDEDEQSGADSSITDDKRMTALAVAENLVQIWITKHTSNLDYPNKYTQFVEDQVQKILFLFGRKRPKEFLSSVNSFLVDKDTRICALTLLCEYIGQQPPHLHQMLQTPLFDNLLKCLQIDTSTRVISLAMTTLVMVLPHIPSSSAAYLPALFNIYSRMLFWDRERKAVDPIMPKIEDSDSEDDEKPSNEGSWVKLAYLLESDDETVPELLHYFTFLYGLYPINFMSYIRKPQKYLRNANFVGADDLDIEPTEIRQRSEPFRQVHLLHPNFFHLTIESELTDSNRWMNSQAPDVVAECMGLYTDGGSIQQHGSRTRGPIKKLNLDTDFTSIKSKHSSWRDPKPAAADDNQLQRSKSHPIRAHSRLEDSPTLPAQPDSPTLPAQIIMSPSRTNLSDLLNTQRSVSGSVMTDSVASLHPSHHNEQSVDEYLSFRAQETTEMQATHVDPAVKIAYLHREIQLLRNDLNFEQFLKAQHLSHIGQLRQKQLREARVEAETQNLINSNRQLRAKLDEAKRTSTQMRKETEKSKSHARKWETDVSNKLRALKEDQKSWAAEKSKLQSDNATLTSAAYDLRQMIVKSERREQLAKQRLATQNTSYEEVSRLKAELKRLNSVVQQQDVKDGQTIREQTEGALVFQELAKYKSLVRTRERELIMTRHAYEKELAVARTVREDTVETPAIFKELLEDAQKKVARIQESHDRLKNQYIQVQRDNLRYRAERDELVYDDEQDHDMPYRSPSYRSPNSRPSIRNSRATDQSWDTSISTPLPNDNTGPSTRSPISSSGPGGASTHFVGSEPMMGMVNRSNSTKEEEKIKPQSEVRIYGRGGVQNIGKKEKGKESEGKDAKKEKKGMGLRGIRGFS